MNPINREKLNNLIGENQDKLSFIYGVYMNNMEDKSLLYKCTDGLYYNSKLTDLGVNMIDDLPANILLEFKVSSAKLVIISSKLCKDNCWSYYRYDEETLIHRWNEILTFHDYVMAFMSAVLYLKQIRFDKYEGRFVKKGKSMTIMKIALRGMFKHLPNVKVSKTNQCCVCNENTITMTPCKHSLCMICWENLQVNNSCGYGYDDETDMYSGPIECPVCRDDIVVINSTDNKMENDRREEEKKNKKQ